MVECLICSESCENPADNDWIPSFLAKQNDSAKLEEYEILCPACCEAYATVDKVKGSDTEGEILLLTTLADIGVIL